MLKEPTYSETLKLSWHLVWRHKELWLFSLFASIFGSVGLINFVLKMLVIIKKPFLSWQYFNFFNLIKNLHFNFNNWLLIIWWLVLVGGLFFAFVFMGTVSQGLLVYVSNLFFRHKKTIKAVESKWHDVVRYFPKLFLINIIKSIINFGLLFVTGISAWNFLLNSNFNNSLLFISIFILSLIFGALNSFISLYMINYIVIEDYNLIEAFVSAWELFFDHILVSIEISLVMLFVNIAYIFLLLLGIYILSIPTLLLILLSLVLKYKIVLVISYIVSFIMYFAFVLVLGSVFNFFNLGVWTYLFTKMHRHGLVSKLLKLVHY